MTRNTEGDQEFGVVDRVLTDRELEAVRIELRRLRRAGLFDDSSGSPERASLEVRVLHGYSALLRALPFHGPVRVLVCEVVPESPCLMLSNCFYKPARIGVGTRWHADDTDYPTEHGPRDSRTIWIAVEDVRSDSGPLCVLPGFKPRSGSYVSDPDNRYRAMVQLTPEEESRVVELTGNAGMAVHFGFATLHCTRDNTSPRDRSALSLHILSANAFQPGYPPGPGPFPIIGGPRSTSGRREYGVDQTQAWEREVERALTRVPVVLDDENVLSLAGGIELATTERLNDTEIRLMEMVARWPATPKLRAQRTLGLIERDVLRLLDGESSMGDVLSQLDYDVSERDREALFGFLSYLVEEDALRLVS